MMIKLQDENTIIIDNSRKKCHQYYSKLYKTENASLAKADEFFKKITPEITEK